MNEFSGLGKITSTTTSFYGLYVDDTLAIVESIRRAHKRYHSNIQLPVGHETGLEFHFLDIKIHFLWGWSGAFSVCHSKNDPPVTLVVDSNFLSPDSLPHLT